MFVPKLRTCATGLALAAALAGSSCASCRRPADVPEATYREAVTAFHTALAALETSQDALARQKLDRVIALVPQEPAGWANLGLLLLRQQENGPAKERLAKAIELAPRSAAIERLLAIVESRSGNSAESIRHWRRALELEPGSARAAYALAQETERQGSAESEAEAQRILETLLARADLLPARLDAMRLAAKRGDAAALTRGLDVLAKLAPGWPAAAQAQLEALRQAASANPRSGATRVVFLKNVLVREPTYRHALAQVSTPLDAIGEPLEQFVVLANPKPGAAPPDSGLTFSGPPKVTPRPDMTWVGTFVASPDAEPVVIAGGRPASTSTGGRVTALGPMAGGARRRRGPRRRPELRLPDGPGRGLADRPRVPAAGRGRPLQQTSPADGLPATITGAPPARCGRRTPTPTAISTWCSPPATRRACAAAQQRRRHVRRADSRSRRAGVRASPGPTSTAKACPTPPSSTTAAASTSFEFARRRVPGGHGARRGRGRRHRRGRGDGDTTFDLVTLAVDGSLAVLTRGDRAWTRTPRRSRPEAPRLRRATRRADLDNNGRVDLIGAAPRRHAFAGDGSRAIRAARARAGGHPPPPISTATAVELIGVAAAQPTSALETGPTDYGWQMVRPQAATATGDQRINSFGVGGSIEVRTGLHRQRVQIDGPIVHVGLGTASAAEVIRIEWPNGVLQSEFDRPAKTTIAASQRLKGSCPWLFAWNGREMAFVTDLIWRSPLGLRINAQDTADVLTTEDWVKVRGDQLVAARRRLRSAHHRGAVGDALLRSRR
jgi:Tfp pilus assembly protein PilF